LLAELRDMQTEHSDKAERQLLATVTGELCQPVRIYYDVPDKNAVNKKFRALKCVQSDPARRRWVWLFDGEAKGLAFEKSYRDIPTKLRPIVIGSFHFRPPSEMHLDLRSIERAIHALPFFDRHLGRKTAAATDFSIVNRLLGADEQPIDFDRLFKDEVRMDLEEQLKQVKRNPMAALRFLEDQMNTPEPEVVRRPLNFYSDGIDSFRSALKIRQAIAIEHWNGNPVSFGDFYNRMLGQGR
jgi:hypothetical protein